MNERKVGKGGGGRFVENPSLKLKNYDKYIALITNIFKTH